MGAAILRYKCAQHLKGDQLAFFLDDFGAEMEAAAGYLASGRDDERGCGIVREGNIILQAALAENKFSHEAIMALRSRIGNLKAYATMCRQRGGLHP